MNDEMSVTQRIESIERQLKLHPSLSRRQPEPATASCREAGAMIPPGGIGKFQRGARRDRRAASLC
jgi:hypothetical protein